MGAPKATLIVAGETLLARQVRMLRTAGVEHITVVLAADQPAASAAARELGIPSVANPDPSRGMASSLSCGVEFLLRSASGPLLVLPVDCAFARSADVLCLLAAMARDTVPERGIWRPGCGGRSGHPVLIGEALLPELATLDPQRSMRSFIQDNAALVRWVEVDNPLLHRDLDHPSDLLDLLRNP